MVKNTIRVTKAYFNKTLEKKRNVLQCQGDASLSRMKRKIDRLIYDDREEPPTFYFDIPYHSFELLDS